MTMMMMMMMTVMVMVMVIVMVMMMMMIGSDIAGQAVEVMHGEFRRTQGQAMPEGAPEILTL